MKSKLKYQDLVEKLKACNNAEWYIYGAGIIAYNIYLSLKEINGLIPKAIIVTTKNEKETFFEPEKIFTLNEIEKNINKCSRFLIATPEIYHDSIMKSLESADLENYIFIDADLEYEIMAAYFRKSSKFLMLEDISLPINTENDKSIDLGIYMAKHHMDRKLIENYELPDYIIPIHVGKKNTEKDICKITDDLGENISLKNSNYSELTATYWVWKNTSHDYKGICHYRRYLVLPNTTMEVLKTNNVDMIVPNPFVCEKDISQQYGRYIKNEDFKHLMRAIKDISEDDYILAKIIFNGEYIYNYNMLVARKEVFDEYSAWMFAILEKAEQYCDPFKTRADRYAGYLGELLTTLYIIKNKDKLNIYHTKKVWLI